MSYRKMRSVRNLAAFGMLLFGAQVSAQTVFQSGFENLFSVSPQYLDSALRNPLKGFTTGGVDTGNNAHPWATLGHVYIKWNEIENDESDGLDKILEVSNQKFGEGPANNIKVIPRVYLHWDGDEKHWPADMQEDDYTSDQFKRRVLRLVERLGTAWNNDSRVAFIELGIFGKWGEHHSPDPTQEMQELVGDAFATAFPDKQVSVRQVWKEFESNKFAAYWDSWAHQSQMWGHGGGIAGVNSADDRYLTHYVGGEAAYNWGDSEIQPGESPTDSVTDPVHRDFIENSLRWLHGTQLRWISAYDRDNSLARQGAEILQRAMGYRFVLENVSFSPQLDNNLLQVAVSVKNEGSAPFYYDWPVEVALLDPASRAVVWSDTFSGVDLRDWKPGSQWTEPQWQAIDGWPGQVVQDSWSEQPLQWENPPQSHGFSGSFVVDAPNGEYVLTLAVLDPAGMRPSLRFATRQYFTGGRHPIGLVALGQDGGGHLGTDISFDDPASDDTLHYLHQGQ